MPAALIVSPFATYPDDAGQRKRARQTTRMLQEAGYDITFVLYAFEGLWRWRWDDAAVARMREEWGDVYVYPAPERTGGPPANREVHGLDEWWDKGFEAYLAAMARLKRFDVVVVHNVWLSKALDLFPRSVVKVIDTHDFFSVRARMMRENGLPMEFFTPREADEVFGLDRADVIWAIQAGEADEMIRRSKSAVRYLPYVDANAEKADDRSLVSVRVDYLQTDRVRFGFIGGGSIFNKLGVDKIAAALTERLAFDPAPVELVLAGSVCNAFDVRQFHHDPIGYVDDEEEFYNACDIVIVPIFDGTGMKVKAIDSLSRRRPLLLSEHAATGLDLPEGWVFSTPEAMAERMCAIAHRRPSLERLGLLTRTAFKAYLDEYRKRRRSALWAISEQRVVIEIDLSEATGEQSLFGALIALSHARFLASFGGVDIVCGRDVFGSLVDTGPPGCRFCFTDEEKTAPSIADEAAHRIFIRPCAESTALEIFETGLAVEDGAPGAVLDHVTQGVFWEPALLKLTHRFKAELDPTADDGPKRYAVWHSVADATLYSSRDYSSPDRLEAAEDATQLAFVAPDLPQADRLSALGALHAIYNGSVEAIVLLDAARLTSRDQIVLSIAGASGVAIYDDATGEIPGHALERRFTEFAHRNVAVLEAMRDRVLGWA